MYRGVAVLIGHLDVLGLKPLEAVLKKEKCGSMQSSFSGSLTVLC